MDQSLDDLYAQYVRATEFFNAQIQRTYSDEQVRDVFRIKTLSKEEFPRWWNKVSKDEELLTRWLGRLDDPAGSFARNCRKISEELGQIRVQQKAA